MKNTIFQTSNLFYFIIVSLLFIPFLGYTAIITVGPSGDYTKIQDAIDNANPSDEIIVSTGTYNEHLISKGENLNIHSTDPTNPTIVDATIIDGTNSGTVMCFWGTEDATCILSGFTIKNGRDFYGSGITGFGTHATIRYCKIINNSAVGVGIGYGEGTGLHNCDGLIEYCTISNNHADVNGGGLYGCDGTIQYNTISTNDAGITSVAGAGGLDHCNGTIQYNQITGNTSMDCGGGLSQCDGIIQHNTISGNQAVYAGGLYECNGTIQNNDIISNTANNKSGGGVYSCTGIIQFNNILNNNATEYGGGVGMSNIIRNNVIKGNIAGQRGGGLDGGGRIQNNIISGNTADRGGGIYYSNGLIMNNTIFGNEGITLGDGIYNCRGFIVNNIIWGNGTGLYGMQISGCNPVINCCIQGWTSGGRNNTGGNPLFVDAPNGDFHINTGSSCINTGYKYYLYGSYLGDMDGQCRIAGTTVDIGADEYSSPTDTDGDLLADADEPTYSTLTDNPDTDSDGLMDGAEVMRGTPPATPNSPVGISIPADYTSIQQAIFLAFPQETITLSPNTYVENLHFLSKNLILQSTDPLNESIVDTTIINGSDLISVITFGGTENSNAIVKGLTIRDGSGAYGAGINCSGSAATIEHNKIIYNTATTAAGLGSGGGICSSYGIIQNNLIAHNTAAFGGGGVAYCNNSFIQNNIIEYNNDSGPYGGGGGGGLMGSNSNVRYNIIRNNSSSYSGGGLATMPGPINNNLIYNNTTTGNGGGCYYCYGDVQNNTIYGNSATSGQGGGVYHSRGGSSTEVKNLIFWGNTALTDPQISDSDTPSYSCIQGWSGGGTGNMSSDPKLANPGSGNFHLESDSPCIDTGTNIGGITKDFEGDDRPLSGTSGTPGGNFDIGADEYNPATNIDDWTCY